MCAHVWAGSCGYPPKLPLSPSKKRNEGIAQNIEGKTPLRENEKTSQLTVSKDDVEFFVTPAPAENIGVVVNLLEEPEVVDL